MGDMQNAGIGPVGQADILKLLEGHHYQIACKKYFDITHPDNKWEDSGTMHPSTYFHQSNLYWKEKNPEKEQEEEGSQGKSKNLKN